MDSYLGEIKLWALTYAPKGWAFCNGALLNITSNQALFSLLNTYYGGDGKTTFALPDLRGRVPIGATPAAKVGTQAGSETVTLTAAQVPPHSHSVNIYPNAGDQAGGLNHHIAAAVTSVAPVTNVNLYAPASANTVALDPATVGTSGGSGAHNNMQPYLALNYFICTSGIYPPRP
jgi:microcystin-dependent protein